MIVLGCDVGSLTTKTVVMNGDTIESYHIVETGSELDVAAKKAAKEALSKNNSQLEDVKYCIGTGRGKENVPFADETVSQLLCLSKGTHKFLPTVGTVIDIGGNAARVINIGETGEVLGYRKNDKCAGGAGKFFEVLAEALEIKLDNLGPRSQEAENPLEISSQCAVFAESEIISLLNEGVEIPEVIAGVNQSVASRIAGLAKNLGIKEDVAIVGGVAKNKGMIQSLEESLNIEIKTVPTDPQIISALGAAILAKNTIKN